MIVPELLGAWTEHSPRACMPSWAGCSAEFPKDWLDLLGRWQAGQSADYVRTAKKRVSQMQVAVARVIRGGEEISPGSCVALASQRTASPSSWKS